MLGDQSNTMELIFHNSHCSVFLNNF